MKKKIEVVERRRRWRKISGIDCSNIFLYVRTCRDAAAGIHEMGCYAKEERAEGGRRKKGPQWFWHRMLRYIHCANVVYRTTEYVCVFICLNKKGTREESERERERDKGPAGYYISTSGWWRVSSGGTSRTGLYILRDSWRRKFHHLHHSIFVIFILIN